MRKNFEVISEITQIEVIARGLGVHVQRHLDREYGQGRLHRWRKLKGRAWVKYADGSVAFTEIHWFEAHGVGRFKIKIVREIEERK